MICRRLSIEFNDGEVTSIYPSVDTKNKGSVKFTTKGRHTITLDENTLRRGIACLNKHRELMAECSKEVAKIREFRGDSPQYSAT